MKIFVLALLVLLGLGQEIFAHTAGALKTLRGKLTSIHATEKELKGQLTQLQKSLAQQDDLSDFSYSCPNDAALSRLLKVAAKGKKLDEVKEKILDIVNDTSVWDKMFPDYLETDFAQICEVVNKLYVNGALDPKDLVGLLDGMITRRKLAGGHLMLLGKYTGERLPTIVANVLDSLDKESKYSLIAKKTFTLFKDLLQDSVYKAAVKEELIGHLKNRPDFKTKGSSCKQLVNILDPLADFFEDVERSQNEIIKEKEAALAELAKLEEQGKSLAKQKQLAREAQEKQQQAAVLAEAVAKMQEEQAAFEKQQNALKQAFALEAETIREKEKQQAAAQALAEKNKAFADRVADMKKALESRGFSFESEGKKVGSAPAQAGGFFAQAGQMVKKLKSKFSKKPEADLPVIAKKTALYDVAAYEEKVLKKTAEDDGYGYKTANLMLMSQLFDGVDVAAAQKEYHPEGETDFFYKIAVPEFAGISSQEVQEFLKQKGLDVPTVWNAIKEKFLLNQEPHQKAAFTTKNYPQGFIGAVKKELEEAVDTIFNVLDSTGNLETILVGFEPATITNIAKVLETTKTKGNKLMVRSTGKEDTATLANAGGNESVANVDPDDMKHLLDALREVVASYFREKSLKQRLGAHDDSLFTDTPFTPAVIQRMIGEKRGGTDKAIEIPRCGVMFTEEAEGSISRNVDKDMATGIIKAKDPTNPKRIATSGITLIQAAYGHNEGVVNSLIAVDSYYIDLSKHIYPVIKEKRSRLVPKQEFAKGENPLERKENPKSLRISPALSQGQIIGLKVLAELLERYYQKPMDVEYVIDVPAETIYVVQARPIVHVKNEHEPSYWKDMSKVPSDVLAKGSSIGVAGGALRIIEKEADCILADTLPLALKKYQEDSTDKPGIKCVLIKEDAPATSHEATAFRSELKPVIWVKDLDRIQGWLKNASTKPVVVDVQREVVMTLDKATITANTVKGWINYPIPALVSARFIGVNNTSKLLKDLEALDAKASGKISDIKGLNAVLEKVKTAPASAELNHRLLWLVKATAALVDKKLEDIGQVADYKLKREVEVWKAYLMYAYEHINKYLNIQREDKFYGRRLYAVRFLQALLGQQPTDGYFDIVSAAMFKKVLGQEKQLVETGIDVSGNLGQVKLQLMKLKSSAAKAEVANAWAKFVNTELPALAKEQQQQCVEMVASLVRLKIAPLWLNSSFYQRMNKNAQKKAEELLKEFEQAAPFIEQLFQKEQELKEYDLEVIESPSKFSKAWSAFATFLTWFANDFPQKFGTTNDLAKLYALDVMKQLVDVFDNGIKAVTGSNNYQKPSTIAGEKKVFVNKAYSFKTMLQGKADNFAVASYIGLLEKWIPLVDDYTLWKWNHQVTAVKNKLAGITVDIDTVLDLSTNFNVGDHVLEPKIKTLNAFGGVKTLEEVFTFTHQSLLTVISTLLDTFVKDPSKFATSDRLQEIKNLVLKVKSNGTAYGVAASVTAQTNLSIEFKVPLRSHSATIRVESDKANKQMKLILAMTGDDEDGRNYRCLDFAVLVGTMMGFKILEAKVNVGKFTCVWGIPEKLDLSKIKDFTHYLSASFAYSFLTDGNYVAFERGCFYGGDSHTTWSNYMGSGPCIPLDQQDKAIDLILELSLHGEHMNLFMLQVLDKLNAEPQKITPERANRLLMLLEKMVSKSEQQYRQASEVRLFKRAHSPVVCGGTHTNYYNYYNVDSSNIDTTICGNHSMNSTQYPAYKGLFQYKLWYVLDNIKDKLSVDQRGRFDTIAVPAVVPNAFPAMGGVVAAPAHAYYAQASMVAVDPTYSIPGTHAHILDQLLTDVDVASKTDGVKKKMVTILGSSVWDYMFPDYLNADFKTITEIVKKLYEKNEFTPAELEANLVEGHTRKFLANGYLMIVGKYKGYKLEAIIGKMLEKTSANPEYSSIAKAGIDVLKEQLQDGSYKSAVEVSVRVAAQKFSTNTSAQELLALVQ